jgi:hypothetical protein
LDGDIDADFFASFADRALLEGFEIVQLSANDTPATGFGRKNAENEQVTLVVVQQKYANADAWDGHGMRGGTYRSCLLIHFAS